MATVGSQRREAPLPSKLMELLNLMNVHTSLTYYETAEDTPNEIASSALNQSLQETIEALRFLVYAKKCIIKHLENTISEDSPRMQAIAAMSHRVHEGLGHLDPKPTVDVSGDDSILDEKEEAICAAESLMSEMRQIFAEYALSIRSELVAEGTQRLLVKKKELTKMTFLLGLLQPEGQDDSDRPACSDRMEAGVDQDDVVVLSEDERKTIVELLNGFSKFLGKMAA